MSEMSLLTDAINRLTQTTNMKSNSSGGGSTQGAAAGVTEAVLQSSMQKGNFNQLRGEINKLEDSFTSINTQVNASIISLERFARAASIAAETEKIMVKEGKSEAEAKKIARKNQQDYDTLIRDTTKNLEKNSTTVSKSNKILEGFSSSVNKAALGIMGFAAAGLHDTVQGYQLGYEFKRLAYEIADALLPVIKDMTKGLRIFTNGLHNINKNNSGGTGISSLGAVGGVFAALALNSLTGGLITKMVKAVWAFGAPQAAPTGAANWFTKGMGMAGRGTGTAIDFLQGGASTSLRGAAAGAAAPAALIGATVALGLWTLYESKRIKGFQDDFSKMKMGPNGWYRPDTPESIAAKKAAQQQLRDEPWRLKKELGNGDRRDWTAEEVAKMKADKAAGKTDGGKDSSGKHLDSIMRTSFGNLTSLWENMQTMSTENPAAKAQEEQLGLLGYIALYTLNILQFLEGQPRTTEAEAMKA